MKRRKFIQDTSLVAFSLGVFGNIKLVADTFVGDSPTTTDILGPFYRPGAPFRADLVEPGTKGEILHFGGTLFGEDAKTPVSGALLEIWHCDENGAYDNTSDNYAYRASFKTGLDGRYRFRTIQPVSYTVGPGAVRPAHIHMRISGHSGTQDLVTQIYFKGDRYLKDDASSSNPMSLNRILDTTRNARNERVVTFDVYLRKEYVLDATAFDRITGIYEMESKNLSEFYRNGDQLFLKLNGQIMVALNYSGNNTFTGGLEAVQARFEFGDDGVTKAVVNHPDDKGGTITVEGKKVLKY